MLYLNVRSLPSRWPLTFSLLYSLNSPPGTVLSIHILSRGADKRTEQCAPGTFKIGKNMSFLVCTWLFLKFSCTRYLTLNSPQRRSFLQTLIAKKINTWSPSSTASASRVRFIIKSQLSHHIFPNITHLFLWNGITDPTICSYITLKLLPVPTSRRRQTTERRPTARILLNGLPKTWRIHEHHPHGAAARGHETRENNGTN